MYRLSLLVMEDQTAVLMKIFLQVLFTLPLLYSSCKCLLGASELVLRKTWNRMSTTGTVLAPWWHPPVTETPWEAKEDAKFKPYLGFNEKIKIVRNKIGLGM